MAHRNTRPTRRRTVVVYLATIVLPSLVLLALSWQSVERQRRAIDSLTASNRLLSTSRLATLVEDRLAELAAACLADPDFGRLVSPSPASSPLASMEERRALARALTSRHPIASLVFVVGASGPQYPLLQLPLPSLGTPAAGASHGAAKSQSTFLDALTAAEQLELTAGRQAAAAAAYQRAAALASTSREVAIAISRLARSLERSGRAAEARRQWAVLARSHGDERDFANQPLGLVAALEMNRSASDDEGRAIAQGAYDSLLAGRWGLGANEVDYFVGALEAVLGRQAESRPASRTLAEGQLARALDASAIAATTVPLGERRAGSVGAGAEFFVIYARTGPEAAVAGFALDQARLRQGVLLPSARELGMAESVDIRPRATSNEPPLSPGRSGQPVVPFSRDLAGFELLGPALVPGADGASLGQAWVLAASTVLTLGALGLGVFLLVRDTARERETTRLRADLVSGVSHELKTPLTLIRVYAETLDDEEAPKDADRHDFCRVITRETDRLTALIDRVLSFSRVERGERTYRIVPGPIDDIVRVTLDGYVGYLRSRGFVVTVNIEDGLPDVPHDRDAVAEALVNLLDNAAKYSGEARDIDVRLHGRGASVVLEVGDHGIGIPPGEQSRIFDRFYRTERELGKGGYGLGLFLVKHIMDAHGGTVELDSAPGKGSRFRLAFPASVTRSEP